jgi:hypothetical protein
MRRRGRIRLLSLIKERVGLPLEAEAEWG